MCPVLPHCKFLKNTFKDIVYCIIILPCVNSANIISVFVCHTGCCFSPKEQSVWKPTGSLCCFLWSRAFWISSNASSQHPSRSSKRSLYPQHTCRPSKTSFYLRHTSRPSNTSVYPQHTSGSPECSPTIKTASRWRFVQTCPGKKRLTQSEGLHCWLFKLIILFVLYYRISTTWAWWRFWEPLFLTCNLLSRATLWPSLMGTSHSLMCQHHVLSIFFLSQAPYLSKLTWEQHLRGKHVSLNQESVLIQIWLQTRQPDTAQRTTPHRAVIVIIQSSTHHQQLTIQLSVFRYDSVVLICLM